MGIFDAEPITEYIQLSDLEMQRKALRNPELNKVVEGVKIMGFYDHEDDITYISDQLEPGSWQMQGVLTHEKEHRKQYKQGLHKIAKCKNELELDAYKAEADYLKKYGQISDKTYKDLMSHAQKVSQCH